MSVRNWSLTRYWAMTCSSWLLALSVLSLREELLDLGGSLAIFPVLILAFAPAFWAGSWAGSHPEMSRWPAGRIGVMWLLGVGLVVLIGGSLQRLGGLALAAVAAPLVVLSWAWRERRTGHWLPTTSSMLPSRPSEPPDGV